MREQNGSATAGSPSQGGSGTASKGGPEGGAGSTATSGSADSKKAPKEKKEDMVRLFTFLHSLFHTYPCFLLCAYSRLSTSLCFPFQLGQGIRV